MHIWQVHCFWCDFVLKKTFLCTVSQASFLSNLKIWTQLAKGFIVGNFAHRSHHSRYFKTRTTVKLFYVLIFPPVRISWGPGSIISLIKLWVLLHWTWNESKYLWLQLIKLKVSQKLKWFKNPQPPSELKHLLLQLLEMFLN